MIPWVNLYSTHRQIRAAALTWTGEVRKRLVALADAGHCDASIRGRFRGKNRGDFAEWSIRGVNGGEIAEPLNNLTTLATARITILALVHNSGHLHAFTMSVEGERPDGSKWALAVHLPDDRVAHNEDGDRQGLGGCSHAALHCHVGPDLETAPNVRVPLPALSPVELVEWVLSQLVPTDAFEPAKWSDVVAALTRR